jgi:hypothetical protein
MTQPPKWDVSGARQVDPHLGDGELSGSSANIERMFDHLSSMLMTRLGCTASMWVLIPAVLRDWRGFFAQAA